MGSIAVGIDLGTTYCCVAKCDPSNRVDIIANEHGRRTTPSYVAFTDQERLIGEAAKNQAGTNPKNTVYGAKRLIGRKFRDEAVQKDMKLMPFEIIDDNDKPKIRVQFKGEDKIFYPEEISAMLLERMKQIAENHFSKKVTEAVITVPAYFSDAQRQATKDAGRIAGLNVMRVINEPTAAAIAYGLQNNLTKDISKNILVFDLGGGTFDVTVLTVEDEIYEVKATNGDTRLGGEDFDNTMMEHFVQDIRRVHKVDIMTNPRALSRLKTACETAKITLSSNRMARVSLDSLFEGKDYMGEISQTRFNELNEHLFQKVMGPVKSALMDAKLAPDEVAAVVMVGGSTKIPRIADLLRQYFTKAELKKDINPDEAVAYGAAILATKMNAEEMSEALQEMTLLDVTPLSLGIETVGGVMSVIIDRNTTVPVTQQKEFLTHRDNQTTVNVQVYEGERKFTKDNNLLGNFRLSSIQPRKVGQVQIIVSFDIDTNGILNVTACQKNQGKESKVTINNINRHSEEEIRILVKRAEDMRLDDEKEKERVKSRMHIESLCLKLRSTMMDPDIRNKMACSEREKILVACTEILSWIDCNYNAEQSVFEEKYRMVHDEYDNIRREAQNRKSAPCDQENSYDNVD